MHAGDMSAMPGQQHSGNFMVGLAWGLAIGFALMLAPVLWLGIGATGELYSTFAPGLHRLWALASQNLQGSMLPFVAVLFVYLQQLYKLYRLLAAPPPDFDCVLRHEQLLDLCANLFFGIGVIWTAIGMRNALLHALGDPGAAAAEGAFAMLQRLVDGGILLALSTTIVGGVGGYLMRAVKSISVGRAMNALYIRTAQQPEEENLAALGRIEALLENVSMSERPVS
jgi:hypothetical protein